MPMTDQVYEKEVEDVIIDVILASKTSHIISGPSNMFLGALSMNPDISFDLFESLSNVHGA
jgi:hypothetical protein